MKKLNLLKTLAIIVPILIAVYAQYYEQKQHKQLRNNCKIESAMNSTQKTELFN